MPISMRLLGDTINKHHPKWRFLTQEINPYQPPSSPFSEVTTEELRPAGRWVRLGAQILDGLIAIGFMLPGLFLLLVVSHQNALDPKSFFKVIIVVFAILAILALVIINLYLIHKSGQTLGKKICNIKIVRTDGSPINLGRYLGLRWLPMTLLSGIPVVGNFIGIIDVLCIFRESNQCLHDQIADTIVVDTD